MDVVGGINISTVLIESLFSFLTIYTFNLFLNMFFEKKQLNKWYKTLAYVVFFVLMEGAYCLGLSPIINTTVSILGFLLISLLYKASFLNKVVYTLFYVISYGIIEVLILNIYSSMHHVSTNIILQDFNLTFILSSIAKLIPFLIIKIYTIVKEQKSISDEHMPITLIVQLLTIPILSIIILQVAINIAKQDLHYMSITITVCIILINIIFLNIYEKLNLMAKEEVENAILNNQIDYYLSLYENIKVERKETLKIKHNIKNNTIKVKTLLIEDKKDEAINELEKILETNNETLEVFSEIPIIDAIVNYKMQVASKNHIQINTEISLNKDVYINYSDISNILGNSLDNAIEACIKNNDENNKTITLKIHQKQNNIYICISNPYEQTILFKNDFPLSSKRKNEYGIGLKTIEKIINNKNNIMKLDVKDNVFKLEFILFETSK